jgi:hypothetical protein
VWCLFCRKKMVLKILCRKINGVVSCHWTCRILEEDSRSRFCVNLGDLLESLVQDCLRVDRIDNHVDLTCAEFNKLIRFCLKSYHFRWRILDLWGTLELVRDSKAVKGSNTIIKLFAFSLYIKGIYYKSVASWLTRQHNCYSIYVTKYRRY